MPPEMHLDPASLDSQQVLADLEAIRRANPQRFEMEQLSGILFLDKERKLIAGYKDVQPDEFWVRGHIPGYPLFPGVLMCEAAAQLCSFFVASTVELHNQFLGFSGMENVRFRATVRPGDRLVLVAKCDKMNRRKTEFNVQGFVGSVMVFHGDIIGVLLDNKSNE